MEPDSCGKIQTRIYFLSSVCHACKDIHANITCGICKMIHYCSAEHRRDDWYQHSSLCRVVYKITQSAGSQHVYEECKDSRHDHYRQVRHETAAKCTQLMKRSLLSWEYEVLFYPRICYKCYETNQTKLTKCQNCNFVFKCDDCDLTQHEDWCPMLKTYVDLIIYQHRNNGYVLPDLKTLPVIDTNMNMKQLVDNLTLVYKNGDTHCTKLMVSEILSYPMTVYLGLKNIFKDVSRSFVSIHLIGAETQAEVFPLDKWEMYLLHLLPSVKKLSLKFIGPELDIEADDCLGHSLCEECRDKGRELNFEFHGRVLYHEYVSKNKIDPPDLVCALNAGLYRTSGFNGQDTWKDTLTTIFSINPVAFLVTAYTSLELEKDLEKIETSCENSRRHVGPTLNPYASIKPYLNIISDEQIPVIFKNYYYMLLTNR